MRSEPTLSVCLLMFLAHSICRNSRNYKSIWGVFRLFRRLSAIQQQQPVVCVMTFFLEEEEEEEELKRRR